MHRTFLVTRPNHELVTNYLYFYSQALIDFAKKKQYLVTDLAGKLANPKEFHKQIKNIFLLILLNGHGSPHIITGWNNQPLITAPVSDYDFHSAIVYARSCQSGKALGPYLLKKNARVFIGYRDNYIFITTEGQSPDKDVLAKLFLGPSNLIVKNLLNGRNVQKSDQKSRQAVQNNIRKVLKSRLQNRQQIAAFLWHNINCQVVLGDDQSKVSGISA